jgi:predicted SnoaL-like aldol condensation-catalyzing enzyme
VYLRHRIELAGKLIAADYIEHDPNLVSESTLVARLNKFQAPTALQSADPAVSIVNGEYVLMMWNLTAPDPDNRHKSYPWNYFQLMRVHGGQVVEHWDQDALRVSGKAAD